MSRATRSLLNAPNRTALNLHTKTQNQQLSLPDSTFSARETIAKATIMADLHLDGAPAEGHCPRKKSVAKAQQQYKVKLEGMGRNGRVNQVVSLMPLGGVIELIGVWNANGTDDGFDPFLKNSVRDQGNFSLRSGLFRLADRRALPGTTYKYLPSPQKQRKADGDPFPRHWYMRLVNSETNEDSVEVRHKIARSICHVSQSFCMARPYPLLPLSLPSAFHLTLCVCLVPNVILSQFLKKSEARDHEKRAAAKHQAQADGPVSAISSSSSKTELRNHYVVPEHWDLTPEIRQPLDHYVTDSFVGEAIYNSMQLEGEMAYRTFATQYPNDAAYFFSGPPYCELAITDFGYQNPYKFFLAGEEDLADNGGKNTSNNSNNTDGNKSHGSPKPDDYFGNVSD